MVLIGRFELRPHPYQGCALPTELYQRLERAAGIEPASLAWKAKVIAIIRCPPFLIHLSHQSLRMVEGEGFEPSKAEPADLQSAPFGRSGTSPHSFQWCRLSDSNQPPADYKSAALPDELKRHNITFIGKSN